METLIGSVTVNVDELLSKLVRPLYIGGYVVPSVNLPDFLSDDIGVALASGAPFSVCYVDTYEGRKFSLRADEDGADCKKIAEQFGGSGVCQSAEFSCDFTTAQSFELPDSPYKILFDGVANVH